MLPLQSFAQLDTVAIAKKLFLDALLKATRHRDEFAKYWLLDQDAASMLSNNNLEWTSKFKSICAINGQSLSIPVGT